MGSKWHSVLFCFFCVKSLFYFKWHSVCHTQALLFILGSTVMAVVKTLIEHLPLRRSTTVPSRCSGEVSPRRLERGWRHFAKPNCTAPRATFDQPVCDSSVSPRYIVETLPPTNVNDVCLPYRSFSPCPTIPAPRASAPTASSTPRCANCRRCASGGAHRRGPGSARGVEQDSPGSPGRGKGGRRLCSR
jgi:hypothetical protein